MADERFVGQVNKIDKGIATAVKQAMGSGLTIDRAGVDSILRKAILKGISPKEGEALILLLQTPAVFSGDALRYFQDQLVSEVTLDGYAAGGKQLKSAAELSEFNSALDRWVGRNIKFWSPGTRLLYTPLEYLGVKKLVKDGKIKVLLMDQSVSTLNTNASASYNLTRNQFEFLPGFGNRPHEIVHEATHTIQDWQNISTSNSFLEADAYIVEAVIRLSARSNNDPTNWGGGPAKAAAIPAEWIRGDVSAAQFVMDGNAVPSNGAWIAQYYHVAGAATTANPGKRAAEAPSELPIWQKTMSDLSKQGSSGKRP